MKYIDDLIKIRILSDGSIYHYTSVQALQGILDSDEFWATKSDFLNDKAEFKYTYELFEENILCHIENKMFRKKLIDAYRNEIDMSESQLSSLSKVMNGLYVISFSTDPDNLLLWSEFSNSMGYNLEFKFIDLLQSFQNNLMWHGEVIYDKDFQLNCLQDALDNLLAWRPNYYCVESINDFDEHTSDLAISYLALDMYVLSNVYSMFFKQAMFAPEKEYRFVFSAFHEKNEHVQKTTKMNFRVKEDALIPYIKVPCKSLNALQSITAGPKNNIDIAIEGIKCYCREKRIEVPVRKSNIPLRY